MRVPAILLAAVLFAGCAQPLGSDPAGPGDPTDPDPVQPDPAETLRATVAFDFADLRDDGIQDVVAFDPAARPAMPLYSDTDTARPDAYTVHDLLLDWSTESGVPLEVRHHAALGYSLTSVDNVTAHSTQGGHWHWALFVDGERTTAGMGSIVVEDDTEVEWRFTHSPT